MRKRWVMLGIVWAVVFSVALAGWYRVHGLEEERRRRESMGELLETHRALQLQGGKLRRWVEALQYPCDDPRIGWLSLQERMTESAMSLGLYDVRFSSPSEPVPEDAGDGFWSLAVSASVTGEADRVVAWLAATERYPFWVVRQVKAEWVKPRELRKDGGGRPAAASRETLQPVSSLRDMRVHIEATFHARQPS
ncbi:MAG: hypothetical protein H5U10_10245 [Desulfacinum sp.]|jgi:hypothetical protein|nr:hypothetical protein [Desulfacinum sp.]